MSLGLGGGVRESIAPVPDWRMSVGDSPGDLPFQGKADFTLRIPVAEISLPECLHRWGASSTLSVLAPTAEVRF